ncbi:MAG: isochorismate synthase MenF [Halanaeroarchaeum sp.]
MDPRDGQESAQTAARLRSRAVSLPATPVRDALRMDRPIHAAWTAPGEPTVVASGVADVVTAEGRDRFDAVADDAARLFDALDDRDVPHEARPRLLGGFAFHDRHDRTPPWEAFPGAWFVLPAVQVTLGEDGGWITVTGTASESTDEDLETSAEAVRHAIVDSGPVVGPPGVTDTERTTSYDQWRTQVEGALSRIESGAIRKVTLAQTLRADLASPFPLAGTMERLGEVYPECFRFAFRPSAGEVAPTPVGDEPTAVPTFFGASPERLVSKHGDELTTGALASTVQRGATSDEDRLYADQLRNDEKFDREHRIVVDSIREQLGPVATDVRTGERSIRKLDAVQHLFTPISATATEDHVLSVVEALHPTPAVGGLPPAVALETIRQTETFDRGWYAAPIGWFDADGNGTFAVGIRSAVAEDVTATLFAGNGIVADSDPNAEWEEVQLKYRPVLDRLR